MKFRELLYESIDSIRENRVRTLLMVMGLIIGVGSVITVVSIGKGAETVIEDLLSGFGPNSLIIFPNYGYLEEIHWTHEAEEITREDRRMIDAEADAVLAMVPRVSQNIEIRSGRFVDSIEVIGTLPWFLEANWLEIDQGRSLLSFDDLYMRKVAILGAELAKEMYPGQNPLGQWFTGQGIFQFQVIGILKSGKQTFISSMSGEAAFPDRSVFIPVSTIKRLTGNSEIYFLQGEAVSRERLKDAKVQILAILNSNHGKWDGKHDKFVIQEAGSVLEMIDSATSTITLFVSMIASIALVVAGIGIMNIMLVSVKERTREIGTRKALGAPASDILNQFMLETLLLCGSGGAAGVLLASVVVFFIAKLAHWPAVIDINTVLLALGLSLGTGLLFGLIPASKAADMDPVEALRYE